MKWDFVFLAFMELAITCAYACTMPPPVPPWPTVDASSDAPQGTPACLMACTTIQQNGCREGADPFCPATLGRIEAERLIVPAQCPNGIGCSMTCDWCASAKTAAEVVARCGISCSP